MKKILFTILLAFFGVICVNAQEIDSLQIKSDTISIESLAARLDKLQHDYDYLYCESKLNSLQYELRIFTNSIDISSNSIKVWCFNSKFSIRLYNSYRKDYDANVELLSVLKENVELMQISINLKIIASNFSEKEIEVLKASIENLDNCLDKAENSLRAYAEYLDLYRNL